MIEVFAPAKVNLYLNVSQPIKTGKFKNYHNLDSLVCFANIGDKLIIEKDSNSFEIIGEFAKELNENNSILKAKELLENYKGIKINAKIILEKNLPIASGIGGGSSDAAAALIGLNQLFALDCSKDELKSLATKIGADVPVCIEKNTIIMRGIGDEFIISPKIPKLHILLANPLAQCPTEVIYKKFDEEIKDHLFTNIDPIDKQNFGEFITELKATKNDLEAIAIKEIPQIGELLENLKSLKNCILARMSGSGATCFAIFESSQSADDALIELKQLYKNKPLWVRVGVLTNE